MAVHVQWDNAEKTTILQQYSGDVTVDEYLYAINRTFHMVMSVSHTVHLIYDRTELKTTAQPMSRVFQVAGKHLTPNLGSIVIVGGTLTTTINFQLLKVIAPALAKKVQFADTLAEAHAMLLTQHQARV
jgi:hypothetical protein